MLDARLEDGARVAAMFPPCAIAGPALTARKFTHRYTLEDLVAVGTLSEATGNAFRTAAEARQNILISGGTGTGKTTLLNAIAQTIPREDRIVLIEETSEILIDKPNLVRFEARRAQVPLGQEEPMPAVTIADLVRATESIPLSCFMGSSGVRWPSAAEVCERAEAQGPHQLSRPHPALPAATRRNA